MPFSVQKYAINLILGISDRVAIEQWLEKLLEMDRNDEEKEIRNEYMWFILLMLQTQRIRAPFNMYPPIILKPLREIIVNFIKKLICLDNIYFNSRIQVFMRIFL